MSNETIVKTIKDVLFYYTSTTYAQKQYKTDDSRPPLGNGPLEGHAFEVKILICEDRFKGFKKAFAGAKNLPNAKDFTKEECVSKLGMEEEPDTDMVLIKFSQNAMMGAKGDRKKSRPIDKIGVVNGIRDRNGLDILPDTNIGNGTRGHLQFKPVENQYGLYLYPAAICITELVEYHPKGSSGTDYDGFGIEGDLIEQAPATKEQGTSNIRENIVEGTQEEMPQY